MTVILLGTFLLTMALGVPIVFIIGLSALAYMVAAGLPLTLIPQRMFVGIDSFVLMAVPFFVLAGHLMNAGGLTKRLIRFVYVLIGNVRGGLAYVDVIASMIFGGITGTATADISSIGSIMIPAMKKEGYEIGFAAALTASAATLGGIIPPSLPFIIFAVTAGNVSIAALFLAGIVPGVLTGLFQMLLVRLYFRQSCPPVVNREGLTLKDIPQETRDALLALIMPVIMVGGILSGLMTPTEASAISCVYALAISFFVYREVTLRDLPKLMIDTAITTGACFMIVAAAAPFGWVLTAEMIPIKLTQSILSVTTSPVVILLLMNILVLIFGCFMETIAIIIVLTPVLLPLAASMGLNLVHFGLFFCYGVYIGMITPPVGICMFLACSLAGISMETLSKSIVPFLIPSLIVLFLCTYWPGLVLFIPQLLGK